MSDSFLGEVRAFAYSNAPRGWVACDGRELRVSGNQALYSLLGTTYGGDGSSKFNVPKLSGKDPISGQARYYFISVNGTYPSP